MLRFIRRQNDILCKAVELDPEMWAVIVNTSHREEVGKFIENLLPDKLQDMEVCIGVSREGTSIKIYRNIINRRCMHYPEGCYIRERRFCISKS